MNIYNKREYADKAHVDHNEWSGILVGSDGYPKYHDFCRYLIAGGNEDYYFKATALEIN